MRIAAELVVILTGTLTIAKFVIWRIVDKRKSNLDHVRQLERDNQEIDEIVNRMKGGR